MESFTCQNTGLKKKMLPITNERGFQTKLELGLQMMKRVQAEELPFVALDFDSLYGRKGWLRDELAECGIDYYADTPANTRVYLSEPTIIWPETKSGKKSKNSKVSFPRYAHEVKDLKKRSDTFWHTLTLRPNERGFLKADFARRRVWTVWEDGTTREEWLLLRRDEKRLT